MLDNVRNKATEQAKQKEIEIHNRAKDYHVTFVQNPHGKNVLDNWVQQYCMRPIQNKQATLFEAGIAEGKRQLIKEILDHISYITAEK